MQMSHFLGPRMRGLSCVTPESLVKPRAQRSPWTQVTAFLPQSTQVWGWHSLFFSAGGAPEMIRGDHGREHIDPQPCQVAGRDVGRRGPESSLAVTVTGHFPLGASHFSSA